jgi:hypothetical protein
VPVEIGVEEAIAEEAIAEGHVNRQKATGLLRK